MIKAPKGAFFYRYGVNNIEMNDAIESNSIKNAGMHAIIRHVHVLQSIKLFLNYFKSLGKACDYGFSLKI